ncbi:hypothetical protein J2S11_000865 [Bacillus horti]|uniref:Protein Atu4866 n=2 Tax=Caldalkalibacillus horti TaxID=77523 RepID=A0ABT9VVF4_9BACI|nr:hypothetical protein [Bacillus horti]
MLSGRRFWLQLFIAIGLILIPSACSSEGPEAIADMQSGHTNQIEENNDSGEKGDGEMKNNSTHPHPYVGMWVTEDGYIRHELLPNGRYDEARGDRESAYQGSYTITGDYIEYLDDTGFTADGEFRDGVLYHAGMVLYREE